MLLMWSVLRSSVLANLLLCSSLVVYSNCSITFACLTQAEQRSKVVVASRSRVSLVGYTSIVVLVLWLQCDWRWLCLRLWR